MNIKQILAVLLFATFTIGAADKLTFDKSHSSVNFQVTHLVISKVTGNFTDYDVELTWDDKDMSKSMVMAKIKTATINTDNEKRDEHLRSSDFFDSEKYPEITFKSTKIEKTGENKFVAKGELTMKGVTKNIELPFVITGKVKGPSGDTRIGIEAETTVNRQDYGVSWSKVVDGTGLVVSDDVKIMISAQFSMK